MRVQPVAVFAAIALAGTAQAAPPHAVAELAWLTGTWVAQAGGTTVRETWLAPLDGAMAGVSQTTRKGRETAFEFMTITTEPSGVVFTARLNDQPPTGFLLQPGPSGEARFENAAHDFPQRVIYRRCGEDLCARIEGTVGGEPKSREWRYRRGK